MKKSIIILSMFISYLTFGQTEKLAGNWTNGEVSYTVEAIEDGQVTFTGGSLHEGGLAFSIQPNNDQTLVVHNSRGNGIPNGLVVEVLHFDDQRVLVFRDAKKALKAWLREMQASENLYQLALKNKINHQLSGQYIREDNEAAVIFLPDLFQVTGLAGGTNYRFALDYIESPMDIISFPNGEGLAFEKTARGLEIYQATEEEEEWIRGSYITSLIKTRGLSSKGDYPGKYPFASTEVLTKDVFDFYSVPELRFMRNEIFARHGYAFNSADMKEYFGSQSWYQASGGDVLDKLSPLEQLNIEIIQYHEKKRANEVIRDEGVLGFTIGDRIDMNSKYIRKATMETGEGSFEGFEIHDDKGRYIGFIFPRNGLVWFIEITNPKFRTAKGIGVGSTFEEAKSHYPAGEVHGNEIEGETGLYIGQMAFVLNANFWSFQVDESEIDPKTKITSITIR